MSAPAGQWEILEDSSGNPVDSLVTAIHAVLIPVTENPTEHPKGKILYWHGRYITNYDNGGKFVTCLFDPDTFEIVQYTVPVWPGITEPFDPSKIFCSGHITLEDGRVLTSGGERNIPPVASRGLKYSFLFDQSQISLQSPPWRNTFNQSPPFNPTQMDRGRWYPQLTRLHTGRIVSMSGYRYESQEVELRPELFDPVTETWQLFNETADMAVPLYNGAHLIPFGSWKGEIFYDLVSFGPVLPNWNRPFRFKPDLLIPEWNSVGAERDMRLKGNSVILPIRPSDTTIRIINLGGGENSSSRKSAEMIEIGTSSYPLWIQIPTMSYERHDAPNALLLPDGKLIVIGGGDESETILTPEALDYSDPDPLNWSWKSLPDMTVPRKYHSTALLLPDGSVWVGGSRIYDNPQRWEFENDMERRIEIYKPGYFFDGIRPLITEAPLTIGYSLSNTFTLKYSLEEEPDIQIESVVLISLPSVTHGFDCNQRFAYLDFSSSSKGTLQVIPPADEYIATPGYYMLFIVKPKTQSESGETNIPSIAKIIKLQL